MTDTAPRWAEYMPLAELQPALRNAKHHDQAALGASVGAFGMVEPVVLDERTGRLLAGHGRTDYLTALEASGRPDDWPEAAPFPPDGVVVGEDGRWQWLVVRGISSRDDAHAEAMGIALNRVGERGGWKPDTLSEALDELWATDYADAIGWSSTELDELIAATSTEAPPAPAPAPPPAPRQVAKRCAPGQLWVLGRHRLLCGDARDQAAVARLLDGATVQLAVTSPPYADRRKYDESTEFRPIAPEAYVDWFAPVAANVARHLAPDGSWFVNIRAGAEGLDTYLYVHDLVVAHVRQWGWHLAHEFCWPRPGMPQRPARRFKPQWEPVYQFARGEWKIRPEAVMVPSDSVPQYVVGDNYVGERRQGDGSDAMSHRSAPGMAYPGDRLPTFSGSHEATGHEAAFPVGLPAWFLRAYTDEGDRVLDPFVGSGSTILAAQQEGRTGYGLELSPRYCDIVLDRWERHTGVEAVPG